MKCTNCGATIDNGSAFCGYCGTNLTTTATVQPQQQAVPAPPGMATAPLSVAAQDAELVQYYRDEFARFDINPGARPRFNWWAFFFGCFWYLAKGLWAKALILLVVAAATGGAAGIFVAVYAGFRGNHDYWLVHRQNKQLW